MLRSVELLLSAHPDNQEDSEFADRISDVQKLSELINVEMEKSKTEGILIGIGTCKKMLGEGRFSYMEMYREEVYYKEILQTLNEDTEP